MSTSYDFMQNLWPVDGFEELQINNNPRTVHFIILLLNNIYTLNSIEIGIIEVLHFNIVFF